LDQQTRFTTRRASSRAALAEREQPDEPAPEPTRYHRRNPPLPIYLVQTPGDLPAFPTPAALPGLLVFAPAAAAVPPPPLTSSWKTHSRKSGFPLPPLLRPCPACLFSAHEVLLGRTGSPCLAWVLLLLFLLVFSCASAALFALVRGQPGLRFFSSGASTPLDRLRLPATHLAFWSPSDDFGGALSAPAPVAPHDAPESPRLWNPPASLRVCFLGAETDANTNPAPHGGMWRGSWWASAPAPDDAPLDDAHTSLRALASTAASLGHEVTVALVRVVSSAVEVPEPWVWRGIYDYFGMSAYFGGSDQHKSARLGRRPEYILVDPQRASSDTSLAALRSQAVLRWLAEGTAAGGGIRHASGSVAAGLADVGSGAVLDDGGVPGAPPRCHVAHFLGSAADAAYALLAQRQGLALQTTALALHLESPTHLLLRRDATPLHDADTAAALHLERLAVAAAPHLLLSSGYMREWLRRFGPYPPHEERVTTWPLPSSGAPVAGHPRWSFGEPKGGLGSAELGRFCWRRHAAERGVGPVMKGGTAAAAGGAAGGALGRERDGGGGAVDGSGPSLLRVGSRHPRTLLVAVDWRAPAEVSLVCNALTLLQRKWAAAGTGRRAAAPAVELVFAGRLGSPGPRPPPAEYDGRGALARHAARHGWRLRWRALPTSIAWPRALEALHPAGRDGGGGSRAGGRGDEEATRGAEPPLALLLLPLLSSTTPYDLSLAAECGLPLLSLAVGGAPAQLLASDRASALVEPSGPALAERLYALLHAAKAEWPTPRPRANASVAARWWREWYAGVARGGGGAGGGGAGGGDGGTPGGFPGGIEGGGGGARGGAIHREQQPVNRAASAAVAAAGAVDAASGFCAGTESPADAPPSISLVVLVGGRGCAAGRGAARTSLRRALATADRAAAAAGGAVGQRLLVVAGQACRQAEATEGMLREARRRGWVSLRAIGGCDGASTVAARATHGRRLEHGRGRGSRDAASGPVAEESVGGVATRRAALNSSLDGTAAVDVSRPWGGGLATLSRALRLSTAGWVLLLPHCALLAPDAVCALRTMAAHAPVAESERVYTLATRAPLRARRASAPADRPSPDARRRDSAGRDAVSRLALPLGVALGAGALHNWLGSMLFGRVATVGRLVDAALTHGGAAGGARSGEAGDARASATGSSDEGLIWALLARAAVGGVPVEPVPFSLAELRPSRAPAHASADCSPSEAGAGGECPPVESLRLQLRERALRAGLADGLAAPKNASAGAWAADGLDLSAVLGALRGIAHAQVEGRAWER